MHDSDRSRLRPRPVFEALNAKLAKEQNCNKREDEDAGEQPGHHATAPRRED